MFEEEVSSVSVPSTMGELSILPKHAKLLTVLEEGIITIRKTGTEEYFSIGGGYLETDGKELRILVSRAYGQDEVDEAQTKKAIEEAERIMREKPDQIQRAEAVSMLRRSVIDLKLLKKRRRVSI